MVADQVVIKVDKLASEVDIESDFLIGRLPGAQFAKHLRETLEQVPRHAIVHLDFQAVDLMDGSFADEVFGTFAAARGRGQLDVAPIVLNSLNEVSRDNLEQALLSRPVREVGLRNCVTLVSSGDNKTALCGKSEEHVKQTFTLLTERGELTTQTLADLLDLGVSAASTRLKVLYDLGLATRVEVRDEQGKQFVYHTIA